MPTPPKSQVDFQRGTGVPLTVEHYRRIWTDALALASRSPDADVPEEIRSLNLPLLRRMYGNEVLISDPENVQRVFVGVTLEMYREIDELYCSQIARSQNMVARIINRRAELDGSTQVSREAIWAICSFLKPKRDRATRLNKEVLENHWQIFTWSPECQVMREGRQFNPFVVIIMPLRSGRVSVFRVGSRDEIQANASLALLDMILLERGTAAPHLGGILWRLPRVLTTAIPLPPSCNRLGIRTEFADAPSFVLDQWDPNWNAENRGEVFAPQKLVRQLDYFFERQCRRSPEHWRREQALKQRSLLAMNREPSLAFPELRELLPSHSSQIGVEGIVEYEGLHFEDPLLRLWPGHPVMLRFSAGVDTGGWVYLDGEVLCRAMGHETLRPD